ncbi:hypothetical protein GCM10022384_64010 [Streptomyces marokkonensis]|uniref:Uncharacterized protein n=1 Tax=Streptomyces marokkonensis TaxID=324855 RepID=A0ABP7SC54_9ACTN
MIAEPSEFSAARENEYDEEVAGRDPLGADAVLIHLPEVNERGDLTWLKEQARALAAASVDVSTAVDACAGLRDLGFLVASAVRHAPELDISPLEPALLRLGALAGEVPRDTVYSYSTRNPRGVRRRSFTGTAEEELFIDSVAQASARLNDAVQHLADVLHADRTAPANTDGADGPTVTALRTARSSVKVLQANLLRVKRHVTPQFFSSRLRPYFPTFTVGGQAYAAPGGAQMPLLAVDVMLFAHAAGDSEAGAWHQTYLEENLRYLPPAHRAVCDAARARAASGAGGRTLAGLAVETGNQDDFIGLLQDVLRFRYPHRQLARNNMLVRPDGSLGSGGYTDGVLDRIIELNKDVLYPMEGGR